MCMHVYMRSHFRKYERTYTDATATYYIYIHTYIHAEIHLYANTNKRLHPHLQPHPHIYIHTYIHAYIHAYIHTYIRTYIHTLHTLHMERNMHKTHMYMYIYIYVFLFIRLLGAKSMTATKNGRLILHDSQLRPVALRRPQSAMQGNQSKRWHYLGTSTPHVLLCVSKEICSVPESSVGGRRAGMSVGFRTWS